ncbi:hypothetical protein ACMA1I_05895 [Pontibacter sp. 13R65]|uniref:hypothetical protein n=1 Tax=Pontibacter sp. 13R65 TaxID=3127458 RepID=UPI00301C536F
MIKPIIIGTGTDFEYFAHLLNRKLDAVLIYESIYRPSPLEKMLMAFLNQQTLSQHRVHPAPTAPPSAPFVAARSLSDRHLIP